MCIVVGFELQEAEMCDNSTLVHVLFKSGTVPTQPCMRGPPTKMKFQRLPRESSVKNIFDDSCTLGDELSI